MVVGVVFSIIYIIYRISFPGRAVLGRVAETGDFEAISWVYGQISGTTHSQAQAVPGVLVYRLSSPLIFANAEAFKNTGESLLIQAGAKGSLPHTVVIDFEEIFLVDDTGASALTDFFDYAQRYGVDLMLARVHSGSHTLLKMAGVIEKIGEDHIYDTIRNAVDAANSSAAEDSE
jgi:SulP family sulfate permease